MIINCDIPVVMDGCMGVGIRDWKRQQRSGCEVSCMPFGVMRTSSSNDGELLRNGKAVSWHIMKLWCFVQGHPCKKIWPWEQRTVSNCHVSALYISAGLWKEMLHSTIGLNTAITSCCLLTANDIIASFLLPMQDNFGKGSK